VDESVDRAIRSHRDNVIDYADPDVIVYADPDESPPPGMDCAAVPGHTFESCSNP
jgi:hypothetical protein